MKENADLNLLENGLDFLREAVGAFIDPESIVSLKYGILHLSSGIELILKHCLSEVHWSLIFEKIDDAQLEKLETGDFISVRLEQSIQRLNNIANINIEFINQNYIHQLKKRRNQIEHYKLSYNKAEIMPLVLKNLNYILDFIHKNIEADKMSDKELYLVNELGSYIGDFTEFIDHRGKQVDEQIVELGDSISITICPNCFQLTFDIYTHKCLFCGYHEDVSSIIDHFLANILGIDIMREEKQGGHIPVHLCPNCYKETLVDCLEEPDINAWVCFECGSQYSTEEISFCSRCNCTYLDNGLPLCNDCYGEVMNEN